MNVTFFDRQDKLNALNGTRMGDPNAVAEVLKSLQHRTPFLCEFIGDNGYNLLLGVGRQCCCSQYSRGDGSPPYLMAIGNEQAGSEEYVEFLTADTPTPIARRFCITSDAIEKIAKHFVMTGQQCPGVTWEEI